MDSADYPHVHLIYTSYLIEEKLYESDMKALRHIVEKLSSVLGDGGFILSTPSNYITSSEFKRVGLDILLNERAGLKTVFIAKKSISKTLPPVVEIDNNKHPKNRKIFVGFFRAIRKYL